MVAGNREQLSVPSDHVRVFEESKAKIANILSTFSSGCIFASFWSSVFRFSGVIGLLLKRTNLGFVALMGRVKGVGYLVCPHRYDHSESSLVVRVSAFFLLFAICKIFRPSGDFCSKNTQKSFRPSGDFFTKNIRILV